MGIDSIVWILAGVMIIGGLLGTFLPLLPGIWMMFAGMALVAWQGNFQPIGYMTLSILFFLALLAHIVDYMAGALGAKKFGASRYAVIGAFIGALVGIFMGFIGVIIFPFIGAVLGELLAARSIEQATKAGIGTWLGLLIGLVFKIAIAFTMLGIFAILYYSSSASSMAALASL